MFKYETRQREKMFQKKRAWVGNPLPPLAGRDCFGGGPTPGVNQSVDLEIARSITRVSDCRTTGGYFRSQAANSGLVSRRISSTADRSWAVMVT